MSCLNTGRQYRIEEAGVVVLFLPGILKSVIWGIDSPLKWPDLM
jgi:hypothetical protein